MKAALLLILLGSFSGAHALPEHAPIAGGIWRLELGHSNEAPKVMLDKRPVMTLQTEQGWQAVVGIPLTQSKSIEVMVNGEPRQLALKPHTYAEQRLTVKRKHVNPSQPALERIRTEFARMKPIYRSFSTSDHTDWPTFQWPLHGPVSSPFGLRRFFNEQPRKPHSGIDIAAPTGTPIVAPANGTVVLTGDFYFNGNSVFIDHGHGLVSMLCHMSRIDVQEGDAIKAGQPIGAVGATGRVTGPHLHWTVSLNDARIDPRLVVQQPLSLKAEEPSS